MIFCVGQHFQVYLSIFLEAFIFTILPLFSLKIEDFTTFSCKWFWNIVFCNLNFLTKITLHYFITYCFLEIDIFIEKSILRASNFSFWIQFGLISRWTKDNEFEPVIEVCHKLHHSIFRCFEYFFFIHTFWFYAYLYIQLNGLDSQKPVQARFIPLNSDSADFYFWRDHFFLKQRILNRKCSSHAFQKF